MKTDLYAEKKRSHGEKDRTGNTGKESFPHIRNLYEPAHKMFRRQPKQLVHAACELLLRHPEVDGLPNPFSRTP
jgi:hypothetical protein